MEAEIRPTRERILKDDFEALDGKNCRKVDTLKSLIEKKLIGSDEVEEATRWLRDYEFGFFGFIEGKGERSTLPGDAITFGLARGKARARIEKFAFDCGRRAHDVLKMMLGLQMSMSAMAREFFPKSKRSEKTLWVKMQDECIATLQLLARYWIGQRKAAGRSKVAKSRELGLTIFTSSH